MASLKQVRWREGMFLRPQHFQQQELFLEARDAWRWRAFHPFCWGLVAVDLQESQLDNFTFSVKSLQAILPGGTVIDMPGNARLPSREFSALMKEAGRPLDVFLGVREREERVPQAGAGDAPDETARFAAVEEEASDLDEGLNPVPIERLRLNARFFFGDEPSHGYETIPLARLLRTGDVTKPVMVDPTFAPPCLNVAAAPALRDVVRDVVEGIVHLLRERREKGFGDDPSLRLRFQAASAAFPVLREMATEGLVHPAEMFRELSRLAGALLVPQRGRRQATEEEIPRYDHADPAPPFRALGSLVGALLKEEIPELFRRVRLKRQVDQHFETLPEEAKQPASRLYLEVEAVESGPRLKDLLKGAKISSPARIDFLKKYVLPGVPTEALPAPPPEVPPGAAASYFKLKTEEGAEWATYVIPAAAVAVFILSTPPDVKINLIVVPPR